MQPVSEAVAPTAEEIADAQAFAEASSQNTVEAYQNYLDKFPEGTYRDGVFADGDYDITRFFKGAEKMPKIFITLLNK